MNYCLKVESCSILLPKVGSGVSPLDLTLEERGLEITEEPRRFSTDCLPTNMIFFSKEEATLEIILDSVSLRRLTGVYKVSSFKTEELY